MGRPYTGSGTDAEPAVFTLEEFCDRYKIGKGLVRKELKSGELEGVRVATKTLITFEQAAEWLERKREAAIAAAPA